MDAMVKKSYFREMAEVTSSQLARITGLSMRTLSRERSAGRLAGAKREGVAGFIYDKKSVITWLRYKCLSHLIDKLPRFHSRPAGKLCELATSRQKILHPGASPARLHPGEVENLKLVDVPKGLPRAPRTEG